MDISEKQSLELQIQMLKEQLQLQKHREQNLSLVNSVLTQELEKFTQILEQRNQLDKNNQILTKNLNELKEFHENGMRHSDQQIKDLKYELNEKINELEKTRIQHDRYVLKLEKEIDQYKTIIEKKCKKICQLEKAIHDQSILNFKETEKSSRISSIPTFQSNELTSSTLKIPYSHSHVNNQASTYSNTENLMKLSNISIPQSMSRSKISSSSRIKQAPNKQFLKMSKDQMKIMMKTLIKSKKQLDQGSSQISMLSQISHNNLAPNIRKSYSKYS